MINKLLRAYEKGTFVTVKDLEKCTGTLNFATQAISVGRLWLQSTYALQWAMEIMSQIAPSQKK